MLNGSWACLWCTYRGWHHGFSQMQQYADREGRLAVSRRKRRVCKWSCASDQAEWDAAKATIQGLESTVADLKGQVNALEGELIQGDAAG